MAKRKSSGKFSKQDEYFMRLAIGKAMQGIKKGQTPFGACIVKKGRAISCEHNIVWQSTDITAHGEICAIRSACKALKSIDLSGCTIYSTCEPCPMCFAACHWAGIDKIIYGAEIKDANKAGFNELKISNNEMKKKGKSTVKIQKDLLSSECKKLFDEWEKANKSKIY